MTLPHELLYSHRLHHESTRCPLELVSGLLLQVEGQSPPQLAFGSYYWCDVRQTDPIPSAPPLQLALQSACTDTGGGDSGEPGAAASATTEAMQLDANARDTPSKTSSAETLPLLLAAATPSQSSGSSSSSHDADAPVSLPTPASAPPVACDLPEQCIGAEVSGTLPPQPAATLATAAAAAGSASSASVTPSTASATASAAVATVLPLPLLPISFYFVVPRIAGYTKACKEYSPGAHDLNLIQMAISQPLLESLRIISNRTDIISIPLNNNSIQY